jgi:hypothetical protein
MEEQRSQKIELGWSDPFTIRQFCSTLRGSYRLVSSIYDNTKNKELCEDITSQNEDVSLSINML